MCRAGENTTEWEIHDECYEKQSQSQPQPQPKKVKNKKKKWNIVEPNEEECKNSYLGYWTEKNYKNRERGEGCFETYEEAVVQLQKVEKCKSINYQKKIGYVLRIGHKLKTNEISLVKGERTWIFTNMTY